MSRAQDDVSISKIIHCHCPFAAQWGLLCSNLGIQIEWKPSEEDAMRVTSQQKGLSADAAEKAGESSR